jgi:hypothetical protein
VVRFGGAADLLEEEVVGYLRRLGALMSSNKSIGKAVRQEGRCQSEDGDSWDEEEQQEEQVSRGP